MNPLVKINQLQLQFENHTNHKTLSNISFEVAHGETLLLLGPSGSGKSTLTLCLNGLFPRELDGQMAGEILFDGKHAAAFFPGELSQLVGVVFQDPETQFCMMQVDDEIAFGLENIGTPPAEIGQKNRSCLSTCGHVSLQNIYDRKLIRRPKAKTCIGLYSGNGTCPAST
ncbi:ABC transporter ATP-binding protein [Virgibacillus halophilus]|uniref:ABC transporter ATP-binding protein n=1 Tax=Tigheibacillus halophilus TaxID=361280 RepID=A0ABU5C899_9BACI|nr:ABC transporter ATP-binding protein [Virgibacillus halophilus]